MPRFRYFTPSSHPRYRRCTLGEALDHTTNEGDSPSQYPRETWLCISPKTDCHTRVKKLVKRTITDETRQTRAVIRQIRSLLHLCDISTFLLLYLFYFRLFSFRFSIIATFLAPHWSYRTDWCERSKGKKPDYVGRRVFSSNNPRIQLPYIFIWYLSFLSFLSFYQSSRFTVIYSNI